VLNAGEIGLQYVPTEEQAADGLTKPLGPTAFAKFVELGIAREGNSGLVVSHDVGDRGPIHLRFC
jgi:hypothetical protein